MKAVLTLLVILFFGAVALAQNTKYEVKVENNQMGFVLDSGLVFLIRDGQTKATGTLSKQNGYQLQSSGVSINSNNYNIATQQKSY